MVVFHSFVGLPDDIFDGAMGMGDWRIYLYNELLTKQDVVIVQGDKGESIVNKKNGEWRWMKGGIRGYNETKTDVGNALNLGLYWLFFVVFTWFPVQGLYIQYIYIYLCSTYALTGLIIYLL